MAWLDDNEPARSQFRCPRRQNPSGLGVIHTAENTPDFVAFDGGAEAVARFIQGRSDPGSYHDLVDSDSSINLVRYSCEAFQDGTGSNPFAWGGSVATRADVWPLAPQAWKNGAIRQLALAAARYARWVKAQYGITVPARRVTRAQSEQRVPGFISHAERDPGRRTDPGISFPWQFFLDEYRIAMGGIAPPPLLTGVPDMAFTYSGPNKGVFFSDGGKAAGLNEATDRALVVKAFNDAGQKLPHLQLDEETFAEFHRTFRG
jgi:hypothetical protein